MGNRVQWTIFCSLMLLSAVGCGDGRTKMGRAPVSGRVLCEGQPIGHVMVYFMPKMEGKNGNVGKFGMGKADPDGNFTISTYDTNDGAVVGKHKVRVGSPLGGAPSDFKCECALNEEVDVTEVEVVEGKNNLFEIKLNKATRIELQTAKKRAMQDAEVDD